MTRNRAKAHDRRDGTDPICFLRTDKPEGGWVKAMMLRKRAASQVHLIKPHAKRLTLDQNIGAPRIHKPHGPMCTCSGNDTQEEKKDDKNE